MLSGYLLIFRSIISLSYGLGIALLFADVKARESKFATSIFFFFIFFLQIFCWRMTGLDHTMKIYPFITHLPMILLIKLYFKRPWLLSISSALTSYLCCQIPRWVGTVAHAILGHPASNHLGYFVAMCIIYYFLKKYIIRSIRQVMDQSTISCMIFSAVPILFYVYDYATTIYTDLLYRGSRGALQFAPSLICSIYLIFIFIYHNESKKQSEMQWERDIIASQLQQARLELDTMREMQNNTVIYRHDMRHHLALIGRLAHEGDIQKINEYLAITNADIDSMTPVRYCENETINLILSYFDQKAKKADIVIKSNVNVPDKLSINDVELCSLLSNALENAIHATSDLEEKPRKIYFRATVKNDQLVIATENPYDGVIEMDGELPKTTKENGHGYGIKSMASIVERHGGLYSFETENGMFILQLLIPLKNV